MRLLPTIKNSKFRGIRDLNVLGSTPSEDYLVTENGAQVTENSVDVTENGP